MRIIAILLFTLLLTMSVAVAQNSSQPEAGQFSVTLATSSGSASEKGKQLLEERKSQVANVIVLWRVSPAKDTITVELDPDNITITGCDIIDTMSTSSLFGQLAQMAIAQGIAQGLIPCSSSCGAGPITRIYAPACVQRIGSGCNTRFASCDGSLQSIHDYRVCCPVTQGSATIQLVFVWSPACSGNGCESTAW